MKFSKENFRKLQSTSLEYTLSKKLEESDHTYNKVNKLNALSMSEILNAMNDLSILKTIHEFKEITFMVYDYCFKLKISN